MAAVPMGYVTGVAEILDTLLLLALPASGKSEIRKYLRHLPPERSAAELHLGPSVQLDDFPYVHLMRRIDDELVALGRPRFYFEAPDRSFRDGRQWGALIELLNEDYADLLARRGIEGPPAGPRLLRRLDAAARRVGGRVLLGDLDPSAQRALAAALEKEAQALEQEKHDAASQSLEGKTVVIEFARGGPLGAAMPLPAPFGYRYSLSRLSPEILQRAAILYVWVTPEESRRKNEARADPADPGSILHHSVPHDVMVNDYGCDDMDWLEKSARVPGTVSVEAGGQVFDVPVARFDNRCDRTTFLRADPASWDAADVRAVHDGLRVALDRLWEGTRARLRGGR